MRKKRAIAIGLALLCVLTETAGCGSVPVMQDTEEIELLEPVNALSGTELAARRNLYSYNVLAGYVYPSITEYSLPISASLDECLVTPGEQVESGTVLLRADDSQLADSIERLEESIRQSKEAYEESRQGYQDAVAAIEGEIAELNAQKKALGNASAEVEKRLDNQIASCRLRIEQNQMKARQEKEIYEMESSSNTTQLKNLREQNKQYELRSKISGTVVSAGEMMPGSWISANSPLVAVADHSKKVIRCAYVSQSDIKKCEDLYAFINGKRYEVTYQAIDTVEYNRILSQNGVVYSTFEIEDEADEVKEGDFAALAEIYSRRENVITVPKNALHRDETGYFVYRMENGNPVEVRVRTGESDNTYTEITDGLSEGDEVLLTENNAYGSNTMTLKKSSFYTEFEAEGRMGYPSMDVVTNPIVHGTVSLVEFHVQNFSSVKAGDVIATVQVEGDEVALYEKQKELSRQQGRLRDAQKEGNDAEAERRKETIANLQEELAEIRKDYATTEIRTEIGGVIVGLANVQAGGVFSPDSIVAVVADESRSYITVRDENRQLVLGNTVTISYTTQTFQAGEAQGTVVTATEMGMSPGLVSDTTYIRLPEEVMNQLSAVAAVDPMGFMMRATYTVTAQARMMDHVIVIPRTAVWMTEGNYYVYVREADGTVSPRSFIPGGSDMTSFWVLEGLEEGMDLCLE